MHVTTGVRSGIELTRLNGLDRIDSIKLRQDGCLAGRNEGLAKRNECRARKDGSQDGRQPKGNESRPRTPKIRN
jgi:hypothetical protein